MEIELEAQRRVNFERDGIGLTPRDFGRLIAALAEERGIEQDEYSIGGVVEELEQRFAQELGKPAALFLPTGTLANHLALRALAPGGGRVIVQAQSHLYRDCGDMAQSLSGLNLIPLGKGAADFSAAEFAGALERNADEKVPVSARVLSIESPVRRHDGQCFAWPELSRVLERARSSGMALHRDGARIHFEAAWRGTSAAEMAAPFDTVYCSLHKCFNAPFGAILAGEADLIEGLQPTRRAFGGAPAGVWPAAAVALHYVEGYAERIAAAVVRARALYKQLRALPGCELVELPEGSHVAYLYLEGVDPVRFESILMDRGITVPQPSLAGSRARFSLHVNESLLHQDLDALGGAFREAVLGS